MARGWGKWVVTTSVARLEQHLAARQVDDLQVRFQHLPIFARAEGLAQQPVARAGGSERALWRSGAVKTGSCRVSLYLDGPEETQERPRLLRPIREINPIRSSAPRPPS
jgi:hypothetical protein